MNDPTRNPNDADLRLLTAYLSGELSEDEATAVRARLAGETEFQSAYNDLRQIWDDAGDSDPEPVINVENALEQVHGRLSEKPRASIFFLKRVRSIAAVGLIAIAAAASAYYFLVNPDGKLIATGDDQRLEHLLDDGTRVVLDENSELAIERGFGRGTRLVRLTGHAYFDVATDSSQSFIVDMAGVNVKVLGTAFEIMTANSGTTVHVTEGKVRMFADIDPDKAILLEAGQAGTWNEASGRLVMEEFKNPNVVSWATRELIFRDTEVRRVAGILSEYFGLSIVIEQDNLEGCTVTTSFTDPGLDEVLDELRLLLAMEIERNQNEVTFKGRSCNE